MTKKTKFTFILNIVLIVICLLGTTACSNKNREKAKTTTSVQIIDDKNDIVKGNPSTIKAVLTNDILIDRDNINCRIVIPKDHDSNINVAASEINTFLYESMGVQLQIVTDDKLSWSSNTRLISLGDTSILTNLGISYDKEIIKSTGYYIKTYGKTVSICGGTTKGTLFGIYEFLKYTIGYEFFAEEEIYVNKTSKAYLYDFDIMRVPSFEYPYLCSTIYSSDILENGSSVSSIRYRISTPFITNATGSHNSFQLVDLYYNNSTGKYVDYNDHSKEFEHLDWLARDNSGNIVHQLNYTYDMEFNETTGEFLRDSDGNIKFKEDGIAATMIKNIIERYLDPVLKEGVDDSLTYFQIGIEDYWGWDEGIKSQVLYEKYHTNSASHVIFINYVSRKINEWVRETYPGKEVDIVFFAYFDTLKPPVQFDENNKVVLDENGNAIPIDKDVILEKNVVARVAPIDSNWYVSFDAESNLEAYNSLIGWSALGKMALWLYSTSFSTEYAQFNNFNSIQAIYKWCYENVDVDFFEDQFITTGKSNPCFCDYRAYIQQNLMWDVYNDLDKMTIDFFDAYYKDASDIMLKYLDELRTLYFDKWEEVGLKGDCNSVNLYIPELWTKGILLKWKGYMKDAYEVILKYKDIDYSLYEKLYSRIEKEELSIRFLLVYLYGESVYTQSELLTEKQSIYDGMKKYDMYYRNARPFDELKGLLGIN